MLNRIVRRTDKGLEYGADPGHVEIYPKQLNIQDCRVVVTPGTKEEGHAKPGDRESSRVGEKLGEHKHSAYRALAARANYLLLDRPDIAFAVKELARSMSSLF